MARSNIKFRPNIGRHTVQTAKSFEKHPKVLARVVSRFRVRKAIRSGCRVIIPPTSPRRLRSFPRLRDSADSDIYCKSFPYSLEFPKVDKTDRERTIYFRVWSENFNAGLNYKTHFVAGDTTALTSPRTKRATFLSRVAQHLDRVEEPSPFISLTSSFLFAIQFASLLAKTGHRKPIYFSIVDGGILTKEQWTWNSPDVCSVLLLHRVPPTSIIACFTLSQLINLARTTPSVGTFLQLELYWMSPSAKEVAERLELPLFPDASTGNAIGALLSMIFPGHRQDLNSPMMNALVYSILNTYNVPGRAFWRSRREFVNAMMAGFESGNRQKIISRAPTVQPHYPESRPTEIYHQRLDLAAGRQHGVTEAITKMQLDPDHLSDIIGSDHELWAEAYRTKPVEDDTLTLIGDESLEERHGEDIFNQDGKSGRNSATHQCQNVHQQAFLRQALLRSWLYRGPGP